MLKTLQTFLREGVPGAGERTHAAGQQQQQCLSWEGEAFRRGQEAGQEVAGVPGIPGRRSRRRCQGRNPSPQPPTGRWRSPPRPHHPWRLPGSRQAGQGQAPSAAPDEVRPQQRRGVGPPREDAGGPGQLQQQRRSPPKGCGARLRAHLWGALQPSGCPATRHAAERCRGGRRRHRP